MIDWLDFVVTVPHTPVNAGHVLSITPLGDVEYKFTKRKTVEGSYSSTIQVKSQGSTSEDLASEIYISGNPAKFLQGHNVFGIDDCRVLAHGLCKKLFPLLGIKNDLVLKKIRKGHFDVKRIDITRNYTFESRAIVKGVLEAIAIKTRSRMGRPQTRGTTVYHGQNSRRHTVKFYCKGEEMEVRKHKLPEELEQTQLKEFADNLLRVELTLRSMELKDLELTRGEDLTPDTVSGLFAEYFGRIDMSAQADIASDELRSMPRAIRSTYLIWKEGISTRNMMSDRTFYRHRSALLGYGVDIALPCESSDCLVIPMFREVTGEPADIPGWAYSENLVYQEARL